jgi:hypothetical protein
MPFTSFERHLRHPMARKIGNVTFQTKMQRLWNTSGDEPDIMCSRNVAATFHKWDWSSNAYNWQKSTFHLTDFGMEFPRQYEINVNKNVPIPNSCPSPCWIQLQVCWFRRRMGTRNMLFWTMSLIDCDVTPNWLVISLVWFTSGISNVDNYWQLLTIIDNYWQLLTIIDNYWQLLTIIE